jgi:hypothetical protein
MCDLRIDILTKEAEEIKLNSKDLDKKIKENKEVESHLHSRAGEVSLQIQKLQDESELIQTHIR